jgi:hypothetical protein
MSLILAKDKRPNELAVDSDDVTPNVISNSFNDMEKDIASFKG